MAAAALGIVVAVALQGLEVEVVADAEPMTRPEGVGASQVASPAITLAEAQALRDEAAALTPAGVAFDERAQARWLPRLGRLEAGAGDPRVAPEVREELRAALQALAAVGIGGGPP